VTKAFHGDLSILSGYLVFATFDNFTHKFSLYCALRLDLDGVLIDVDIRVLSLQLVHIGCQLYLLRMLCRGWPLGNRALVARVVEESFESFP